MGWIAGRDLDTPRLRGWLTISPDPGGTRQERGMKKGSVEDGRPMSKDVQGKRAIPPKPETTLVLLGVKVLAQ